MLDVHISMKMPVLQRCQPPPIADGSALAHVPALLQDNVLGPTEGRVGILYLSGEGEFLLVDEETGAETRQEVRQRSWCGTGARTEGQEAFGVGGLDSANNLQ